MRKVLYCILENNCVFSEHLYMPSFTKLVPTPSDDRYQLMTLTHSLCFIFLFCLQAFCNLLVQFMPKSAVCLFDHQT